MKTIDLALVKQIEGLAKAEHELKVEFLRTLGELDERRIYLELGYASCFAFLTQHLKLSEGSAYRRVTAARMLRNIPAVGAFLKDGRVTLKKVCYLRAVLTVENAGDLLERSAALSEKKVEALAVSLDPARQAPVPKDRIRPIAPAVATPPPATYPQFTFTGESKPVELPIPVVHEVRMAVGPEFLEVLGELKSALSHVQPNGRLEDVLLHAMKVTLREHRKRVRAETEKPRAAKNVTWRDRTIPASVRREVFKRDGGRCTFTAESGLRCSSKHKLELHHRVPFARGGPSTTENLTVHCRAHNNLAARHDFGDAHMNQFSSA